MNIVLRPYQHDAINNIRQAFSVGERAPLLVLATGSGKTIIFCDIAERMVRKNKRALILVHRQELLRQTSEHLNRLGVSHGLIAPGYSMTGENIQVGSVQTVARRLGNILPPDLIILDECHHATAGQWSKTIKHFSSSRLLGVTATPERLDGQGLGVHAGGFFDTLITGPDTHELIKMGYLSQPLVYAPPVGIDTAKIKIKRGDYDAHESEIAIDKPKITGDVIAHYKKICPDAPALVFCVTIKHAEDVAAEFNAAGIPSAVLHGKLSDAVRKYRVDGLRSGEYRALMTCDLVSEGFDVPVLQAALLLRPTASFCLYRQQVGRALRVYPGKTHAVILDHVGNCLRHGLPDAPHRWTLDGAKKNSRKPAEINNLRTCHICYAVYSSWMIRCPQCGADAEMKGREIESVEGELILQNMAAADEIAIKKREDRIRQGRAQSLDELLEIARNRGYKPGWAYILWNKKKNRVKFQEAIAA